MLEVNKKQVPLKSYSLRIRIDSVNQILRSKEKITQIRKDSPEDSMYMFIYQIIKSSGSGPHNSLRHADNIKYFFGALPNTKSKGRAHV